MHKGDKIRQVQQPESLVLGCNLPFANVRQNRRDTTMNNDASWTCHCSFDGTLVQLDFVVSFSRLTLVRTCCDYCISVGLDHRCVHCTVTFVSRKRPQRSIVKRVRNWMPRLDSNNQPSEFQNFVRASLTSVRNHGSIASENILVDATTVTGHSQVQRLQFRVSPLLRQLRFTSVTTAPCTKSTMSERTEPSDSITPS